MNLLGLRDRGSPSCSDRPYRLIGNYGLWENSDAGSIKYRRYLPIYYLGGDATLTLPQSLAHANNWRETCAGSHRRFLRNQFISITVPGPALGMPHNGVTTSMIEQHTHRRFPGISTSLVHVDVLTTDRS